ncbi:Alpha/Beta hydrolase protein [Fimicolochytrium jonesii]|uniref:Alpha/Beta hydrolase protein n=1 Tax=Fimicolochytrium jonesii TaxID=1396493 RepID=UPI0022FE003F|nr:Alpha/Beta hydrolase protein [Fimicolochytrium jonesii]KAI8825987.1 Alpha/Beta hydrolase protein [Fimicolochytrium jonesii]
MRFAALITLATASLVTALPSNWKHLFHKQFSSGSQLALDRPGQDTVNAWNIHTLAEFPNYTLRVKEEVRLCDPDVKQYVGYVDVAGKSDDKHFFFWFFESRRDPAKDPFVLWLNGGPGCSSMTGLFMELGPCRVDTGGNGTTNNPDSWNNEANLVFLDQPINVGFSYTDGGDEVTNTIDAADDVYAFLQLFLSKYNKYKDLDFHVTGESYAGHYVPAIGAKIAEENEGLKGKGKKTEKLEIKLKGLAIGNGLTDPLNQYEAYADMAADDKYGPILDESDIESMRSKWPTCKSLINSCYKYNTALTCVPGAIYCNNAMIQPFQKTGLNIYDIRHKCDPSNPLCYSILTDIESYLNRPDIQEILQVDRQFEGCKQNINMRFMMAGDWMRPFVRVIPPLLAKGIKVLIYAGDADFICNWIGNKDWALALEWDGAEEFQKAKDIPWISKSSGKQAGEIRTHDGFTFLRVYEAGHMVPYDQPKHSSEMINTFIKIAKK